jgi:hypothetical protein
MTEEDPFAAFAIEPGAELRIAGEQPTAAAPPAPVPPPAARPAAPQTPDLAAQVVALTAQLAAAQVVIEGFMTAQRAQQRTATPEPKPMSAEEAMADMVGDCRDPWEVELRLTWIQTDPRRRAEIPPHRLPHPAWIEEHKRRYGRPH